MPEITIDIKEPKIISYYTNWAKQCAIYGKTTKNISIPPAVYTNAYPYTVIQVDNNILKVKISYDEEIVE